MRTIVGAAIGVLALGVVMLGYSHRERGAADLVRMSEATYRDARGDLVSLRDGASKSSDAMLGTPGASNGSVLVRCEADQQAIVRQVRINGQDVSQVDFVGQASAPVYVDQYGRPVPVMSAPAPASDAVRVVPAVSTYPAAYPAPRRVVTERRVAYRDVPERKTRRTWQKSALIIGGSAGAGGGVGAIAGGKKGALIGAAIGGGAASIYEAMKRR